MDRTEDLFVGVDLGTGGVRVLAATSRGEVAARCAVTLDPGQPPAGEGLHEQFPHTWWQATCQALAGLVQELRRQGIPLEALRALAVDGTSGTLVCLDREGQPLRPAIMYNDSRSRAQAEALNGMASDFCQRLGYRFEASFALAKIAWVREHEPEVFAATVHLQHQADYIQGCLTGQFGVSDYSNALKTGYDLLEERWPDWLAQLPGVAGRLPRVAAPGTVVGQLSAAAASQTGLPAGLAVVAGATDGTAGCLASGVRRPGDYNTTLGTTLVFKGISASPCRHPQGLIYSHKLPGGYWLPGAASNTGGEWVEVFFRGADLKALDAQAQGRLPSACLVYPLARKGERFPFLASGAEGFRVPEPVDQVELYAACLQGVGLVERLAYQVLDQTAGVSGGEVFSTGGGSTSRVWMQCRADVTGRVVHRPACPESAFGSAVLAASGFRGAAVWQVVEEMVRVEQSFAPDPGRAAAYEELWGRFVTELERRGYG